MEMNTRLQVEHPVTEMVTGQDLVEWQLRVAAGSPLPLPQEELELRGHAFEARIYAEDPENNFLPATGRINHLRTPAEGPHVRIDTGVREGDEVSVHYDPMIAKLVVWDENRDNALRRLRQALADFHVVGPTTNVGFLQTLTAHPAFAAARLDTSFIDRHRDSLFPKRQPASDRVLALACLAEFLRIDETAHDRAAASGDPYSPWHVTSGWVLNDDNHHTLHFRDGGEDITVTAHYRAGYYLLELPGGDVRARGELDANGDMRVDLDGVRFTATVAREGQELTVISEGLTHQLVSHDPLTAGMEDEVKEGSLTAPMPGTVVSVMVSAGDRVEEGASLMVLEAMKMEYTIKATTDGVVEVVNFTKGEQVSEGAELLAIRTDDS
jgi:3-methylcrotonyl-CoA carboxylase alpha subunit